MALKIMIGLQWHIVMVQLKVNASTKGQKNGYNLVELRCWNMHQIALNKRCRTLNKRCRNDTWGYLRLKFHKSCFQWLDHPISSNTVLWGHDVYRMKPCPSWFHWGPSSAQSFETKLFLGTPWRREQHGTLGISKTKLGEGAKDTTCVGQPATFSKKNKRCAGQLLYVDSWRIGATQSKFSMILIKLNFGIGGLCCHGLSLYLAPTCYRVAPAPYLALLAIVLALLARLLLFGLGAAAQRLHFNPT